MVRLDRQEEITSIRPTKEEHILDSMDTDGSFFQSIPLQVSCCDDSDIQYVNYDTDGSKLTGQRDFEYLQRSRQDLCVNNQNKTTQLVSRLNFCLWDMAIRSLHQKPEEARIWMEIKDYSKVTISKDLPLHIVCQQRSQPAPRTLFEALLNAYPDASKCTTMSGDLPIHLVCGNENLLKSDGKGILQLLLYAHPGSLSITNGVGLKPLQILESLNNQRVKLSIQYIKEFMSQHLHQQQKSSSSVTDPIPSPLGINIEPQSPVTTLQIEEGQEGFASQLNQMRIATMKTMGSSNISKKQGIVYDMPTYLQSPIYINNPNPLADSTENDCRDVRCMRQSNHFDTALLRNDLHSLRSSGSEGSDLIGQDILTSDQNSFRDLTISLAKFMKENAMLRRKTSKLTEENVSFRSDYENKGVLVDDLRSAVEREREFCKSQVKELGIKLASTEDKLLESVKRLDLKTKAEKSLAQQISQLESHVTSKRAENSTIKAALDGETAQKSLLQADLMMKSEEVELLTSKVRQAHGDLEETLSRYEDLSKELETMREVDEAHRAKIKELQFYLDERDIQLRAITESKGTCEKKFKKIERANELLAVKFKEMKDVSENDTKNFSINITKLQGRITELLHIRDVLIAEKGELTFEMEKKECLIKDMTEKNNHLEETLHEAQEIIGHTLADTIEERNCLLANNKNLQLQLEELEKKSAETASFVEKRSNEAEAFQEVFLNLKTDCKAKQHAIDNQFQKIAELEMTLDAIMLDNEAKSSLVKVLQSTVTAYNSELQRLISVQAKGERTYAEASNRLVDFESRLGSSEFTRHELKKKFDKSRLQTKQIAEVTARFQVKIAEQARTIESLTNESMKLVKKNENLCEHCSQLKVLIEQRKKTEDDQRTEIAEIRTLNRMQGDVLKDLEDVICDQRTKILMLQHDHRDLVSQLVSEKTSLSLELADLQQSIEKLREENTSFQETVQAFECTRIKLEEENSCLRDSIIERDNIADSIVQEHAHINCENLLRLYELAKAHDFREREMETQHEAIQIVNDELRKHLLAQLEEKGDTEQVWLLNKTYQVEVGRLLEAHSSLIDKLHDQGVKKEESASRSLDEKVALTNGIDALSDFLQKALEHNSDLQGDVEETNEKALKLFKRQRQIEDELESARVVNDELRKLLLQQKDETEKELALNQSSKIEVERLVNENSSLQSNLHKMNVQNDTLRQKVSSLEQMKADFETISSEIIGKVVNMLTMLASDAFVQRLILEKGSCSQEHNRDIDDCYINFSNMKNLMKNIIFLEEKILALVSINWSPLEEADSLKDTCKLLHDSVKKLKHENDTLTQNREKLQEENIANCANIDCLVKDIHVLNSKISLLTSAHERHPEETECLKSIIRDQEAIVNELEILVLDKVENLAPESNCNNKELGVIAEKSTESWPIQQPVLHAKKVVNRLKATWEARQSEIDKLKDEVLVSVEKVSDVTRESHALHATVQMLKLENNILKTEGNAMGNRAKRSQDMLYEENKTLRESIWTLTQQTKDHQLKFMQLATKQASLRRKKTDALDLAIHRVLDESSCRSSELDELSSAPSPVPNLVDEGSVEVVLVEESRDEESK